MGMIASQITSLTVVYSAVYSDADHRKHQSSTSLAFVLGIHRGLVNSQHKGPVTWKIFPFDDVIMLTINCHCKLQMLATGWHDRADKISWQSQIAKIIIHVPVLGVLRVYWDMAMGMLSVLLVAIQWLLLAPISCGTINCNSNLRCPDDCVMPLSNVRWTPP